VVLPPVQQTARKTSARSHEVVLPPVQQTARKPSARSHEVVLPPVQQTARKPSARSRPLRGISSLVPRSDRARAERHDRASPFHSTRPATAPRASPADCAPRSLALRCGAHPSRGTVSRPRLRSARSTARAMWRGETVYTSGCQDGPTIRTVPSDPQVSTPGGLKGRTSLALRVVAEQALSEGAELAERPRISCSATASEVRAFWPFAVAPVSTLESEVRAFWAFAVPMAVPRTPESEVRAC